jgi:hypothetical protein
VLVAETGSVSMKRAKVIDMILKYIFMAFDTEMREFGLPPSAAWKEDLHRSLPNA